jgi:hypothetical protein
MHLGGELPAINGGSELGLFGFYFHIRSVFMGHLGTGGMMDMNIFG